MAILYFRQNNQQIVAQQNPLLAIFSEFNNCPQHRGIILSLSACIQVTNAIQTQTCLYKLIFTVMGQWLACQTCNWWIVFLVWGLNSIWASVVSLSKKLYPHCSVKHFHSTVTIVNVLNASKLTRSFLLSIAQMKWFQSKVYLSQFTILNTTHFPVYLVGIVTHLSLVFGGYSNPSFTCIWWI